MAASPCPTCGTVGRHWCLRPADRDELRLVQIAADGQGFVGLDSDGRVWTHIPGNGWLPLPMNVIEERRGP